MLTGRKKLGNFGEEVAARYLVSKGYKILKRNWFCYAGELDIIAYDGQLVFVEVKTVTFGTGIEPEELLTREKLRRFYKTAQFFLKRHKHVGVSYRFDLVAITKSHGLHKLIHYFNCLT